MANEKRLIDANTLEAELKETHIGLAIDKGKMFRLIKNAPTVDAVEVVHGRWEDCSDKDEIGMNLRCVVCGGRADSFVGGTEDWYCLWKPNFCPHCGAKKDGDGNA